MTSAYLNPRKIELYGVFNRILNAYLKDINDDRVNSANIKTRQWWFPEAPEVPDDNFPRGVIDFGDSEFVSVGADNYVDTEVDGNFVTAELYGQIEKIPVTLSVFIKKDQKHTVMYPSDSTNHPVKNKKQADFFAGLIPMIIMKYEDELNSEGFFIDGNITSGGSYEDGDFFWAMGISFNVSTQALWKISYAKGNLILNYDLIKEVELV